MPKLAVKEYCTGCTACASVCPKGCITMTADKNGFICPVIDEGNCVACGLCEKTCPIETPLKAAENDPKAYAAYSKEEAVRIQSSSGGVFTEIAKEVLANDGVVFGAAYNEQFEVVHIFVEAESDLAKLRGAKYSQSNLCGIFREVQEKLGTGQLVLFSGTPCQVGGLKAYLGKDYANLLTVDFVCHSVPSPLVWKEYIKYRAQRDNSGELPQAINLRSKITGWSRYQYSNLFEYADGTFYAAKSDESIYMKLFMGGYINRESCENCQFKGYARVSDLTLGDFWGIWDIAPELDDNKGTSVVLVQSIRGVELLSRVDSKLVLREVCLTDASHQNPAVLKTLILNTRRKEVLKRIKNGKFDKVENWVVLLNKTRGDRMKSLAPKMLRRVFGK